MARNLTTPVYSGKLVLDRVTGIRPDKNQRVTPIQRLLKSDTTLPVPPKSMKTQPNTFRGKSY